MDNQELRLVYVACGCVLGFNGVLEASLVQLSEVLANVGEPAIVDLRSSLAIGLALRAASGYLPQSEAVSDLRRQWLTVLDRYCDVLVAFQSETPADHRAAAAEFFDAQLVLSAAVDQLQRRMGMKVCPSAPARL